MQDFLHNMTKTTIKRMATYIEILVISLVHFGGNKNV